MTAQANSKTVSLSIAGQLLPVVLGAQTVSPAALAPKHAAQRSPWALSASMAAKAGFDHKVFVQNRSDQVNWEDWTESRRRWC